MKFHVYILHSVLLNKYYVGFTGDDITERLRRHNTNHKGFTGGKSDWIVVYTEVFVEKASALKREKKLNPGKVVKELRSSLG